MQKIVPHLWFDTQAKEAAEFYTSLFSTENGQASSKITRAQKMSLYLLMATPNSN